MKVCFVTSYLYPYLKGEYPNKIIGGAEFQQQQIIAGLGEYDDVELSIISLDYGQPDGEIINGVTVWKTYKEKAGIKFLRFFYPKLFLLWMALTRANADIYYLRAASFMLLPVAVYCRLFKKKMVYASAHDTDFQLGKELVSNGRDLWCYKKGLLKTDLIINQSDIQRRLLIESYGLEGLVIRNFSRENSGINIIDNINKTILWVATIRRFKRAELFLDIAEACPEYRFIMVGGPDEGDQAYFDSIKRRAKSIVNVDFMGFVAPSDIGEVFNKADVFINTSVHEGFPNTFLQSWCRGIPVITFFDPDNVVSKNNLGIVIQSIEGVKNNIDLLISLDISRREEIMNYYNFHHGPGVAAQYYFAFNKLLEPVHTN